MHTLNPFDSIICFNFPSANGFSVAISSTLLSNQGKLVKDINSAK
jgi:hypothetical protein